MLKLSPRLRGRLAVHSHGEWISKISFFNCSDQLESHRFIIAVATEMERAAFTESEVVPPAYLVVLALVPSAVAVLCVLLWETLPSTSALRCGDSSARWR